MAEDEATASESAVEAESETTSEEENEATNAESETKEDAEALEEESERDSLTEDAEASKRAANGILESVESSEKLKKVDGSKDEVRSNARIYLSSEEKSISAGYTATLIAASYPDDIEYFWESDDESIATVDENGVVYGWSKGSCRIYVKAKDGSASACCTVNVTSTLHRVDSIEELQSPHDYENGCSDVWEYSDPKLKQMAITFSEDTEVENGADRIIVTDGKNKEFGVYTGKELAGRTVIVDGNTIRVRLNSNTTRTAYGFRAVKLNEISKDFQISSGTFWKYRGTEENVVIPDGVIRIGERAFENNQTIKSVVMPDSVTTIGNQAFSGCSGLEHIDLGKVQSIGDAAFKHCPNLKDLDFPEELTYIGFEAFFECTGLRKIIIPDKVREIIDYTFYGCTNLDVVLPKSLEAIGYLAFGYCTDIQSITIPKDVHISIPWRYDDRCAGVFEGSTIKNMYFDDGTEVIQGYVFYEASVENVYIPETVENVVTSYNEFWKICIPADAIIHGKPGSYAHLYAKEHNYKFISTEDDDPVIQKPVSELDTAAISDVEYTGAELQPKPVVKDGETVLEEGIHYTLTYASNKAVGTGYVTITGIPENGYEGTKQLSFDIKAFSVSQNTDNRLVVSYSKTVEFHKQGAKPKVTVSFKNADGTTNKLKEGTDYTVSYKNNKKFSSKEKPSIVVTGKGNYAGSKEYKFSLKERNINKTSMTAIDRVWINAPSCYATISYLCDSNALLLPGVDYDLSYVYAEKTVVKVSGKKVTRKAGDAVGAGDVIPVNTALKVIATGKKGSGYTGTVSATYRLYSLQSILKYLFG